MEYGETEKQKEFNNNNDSGAENGSFKDREIPVRHGWEIDLSKLIIKSMIARGTFGIVHRVVYDDLDVEDISDNEIHHFSLDLKGKVTSKRFSEINSISKYSAKFSGTEVSFSIADDVSNLLPDITLFLQKIKDARLH